MEWIRSIPFTFFWQIIYISSKFYMELKFHLILCAVTSNASFLNLNLKDGWTLVPTRSGIPVPVSIESAFSQPQLLFNVEDDVVFELYTQKNKHEAQILTTRNISSFTTSNFDRSLPTRIYIHGWQEYAGTMKKYFNDGMTSIRIIIKSLFLHRT